MEDTSIIICGNIDTLLEYVERCVNGDYICIGEVYKKDGFYHQKLKKIRSRYSHN